MSFYNAYIYYYAIFSDVVICNFLRNSLAFFLAFLENECK